MKEEPVGSRVTNEKEKEKGTRRRSRVWCLQTKGPTIKVRKEEEYYV